MVLVEANLVLLYFFTEYLKVHYLLSQIFAVFFSLGINFFGNKFWTFKKLPLAAPVLEEKKSAGKEVLQFFIISLIGFAINVGIAHLVVNVWGPHFGINKNLWGTIGAMCGTVLGLVWNFLGYKLVVFKK